jgi:hypothetical protein
MSRPPEVCASCDRTLVSALSPLAAVGLNATVIAAAVLTASSLLAAHWITGQPQGT